MSLRYIRLIELLGKAGFQRFQRKNILLVGVGAIGSEIAKNLTTLGVNKLILVDRDYVDMPNLALSFLYTKRDAEKKERKAIAAADKLRDINPDVEIVPIPKPVEELETKYFRDADITVLAVDNDATRLKVNSLFLREEFDSYLIDCGAHGLRGEVTTVNLPRTGCLRCVSLLKEEARHPCLPSHIFDPQDFVDYVNIAKIQFYEEKNEILDPDNPEHINWILDQIKNTKKEIKKTEDEKVKEEVHRLLKNPIRFYPSTFIRTAALATKKILKLGKLSKEEINRKSDVLFTQLKILGTDVKEYPVKKRENCPQCGTGKISLVIEEGATLQDLVQKLKTEYGFLSPRIWKLNGELLFDSPKNLSKTEEKWVKEKIPKRIMEIGINNGSIIFIRSNTTNNELECKLRINGA